MADSQDALKSITQELRRGTIVLAVLSRLGTAMYGYSLIVDLAEHGVEIDQGTLYPLLRRLEQQGLLESNWNTEGSRPRRYYALSVVGRAVLDSLTAEWRTHAASMDTLLGGSETGD